LWSLRINRHDLITFMGYLTGNVLKRLEIVNIIRDLGIIWPVSSKQVSKVVSRSYFWSPKKSYLWSSLGRTFRSNRVVFLGVVFEITLIFNLFLLKHIDTVLCKNTILPLLENNAIKGLNLRMKSSCIWTEERIKKLEFLQGPVHFFFWSLNFESRYDSA